MHHAVTGYRLISASWQMAPEAVSAGTRSGISAAIWRQDAPVSEVQAQADPLDHRLAVTLDPLDTKLWYDRRLHVDRKLPTGSCLLVPAGVATRGVCRDNWRLLHVFVPHAFLRRTLEEAGITTPLELVPRPAALDPVLARIAETIARSLSNPDPFAQLALDAAGLQVALEILRRYSSVGLLDRAGLKLTGWQLSHAIEFLHEHIATPVRLADIAEAVGLSPYHFCRAFASSVGLPPHKYLRQIRMRKGEALLSSGRATIEGTAARLGYSNAGAFARAFKRETGLTPRAFRAGRRT